MRSGRRFLNVIANLSLICLSLGVAYVVLGAIFLRVGPYLMPQLSSLFPVAANIWWQASAPDPVNQDYIAIAGDSYAAGVGDWNAGRSRSVEPYHVGDVIREVTGIPSLSIAQSGAGSAEGLVLFPTRALNADRCLIFGKPRRPQQIVLLLYEGNDLNNNITYIQKELRTTPHDPELAAKATRHLRETYGRTGLATCLGYFSSTVRTMVKVLRPRAAKTNAGPPNRLLVDDRVVEAPAYLQGPALELDEDGVRAALSITERSLEWVKSELPGVPVTVVLMPSVLSTYRLEGDTVSLQVYQRGKRIKAAAQVAEASDRICSILREITLRQGARFVDTRAALRETASKMLVHGPLDWKHFNREGYTVVGRQVGAALTGTVPTDQCNHLAAASAEAPRPR